MCDQTIIWSDPLVPLLFSFLLFLSYLLTPGLCCLVPVVVPSSAPPVDVSTERRNVYYYQPQGTKIAR